MGIFESSGPDPEKKLNPDPDPYRAKHRPKFSERRLFVCEHVQYAIFYSYIISILIILFLTFKGIEITKTKSDIFDIRSD